MPNAGKAGKASRRITTGETTEQKAAAVRGERPVKPGGEPCRRLSKREQHARHFAQAMAMLTKTDQETGEAAVAGDEPVSAKQEFIDKAEKADEDSVLRCFGAIALPDGRGATPPTVAMDVESAGAAVQAGHGRVLDK